MKKVHVLLSAYNGQEYIKQQIKSIFDQNGVSVRLTIRDDGSTDNTKKVVSSIIDERLEYIKGENLGFASSFWQLVQLVDNDSDFYAFCDQDDYWFQDKLITAVNELQKENPAIPLLYTGNVIKTDKDLIASSDNECAFDCKDVLSFPECLKISKVPGCTFVFNKELKLRLEKYKGKMIAHDWTAYIIANATGKVLYDPTPHMYYRIHGSNTVGIENKINTIRKRINRLNNPDAKNARLYVATQVLNTYKNEISKEKLSILIDFCEYKNSISNKCKLLKYREYRDLAFVFVMIMNRL